MGEAAGSTARLRMVSLGRYATKGVARPQELFALDSCVLTATVAAAPAPADARAAS